MPTTGEIYPGLANAYWFGFVAPSATPARTVDAWWRTLGAGMKAIATKPAFQELGYVVLMHGPDEFAQTIREELKKNEEFVKKNNIQG